MTLDEARIMVAAAEAATRVGTATEPFLRALPRGIAQGAESRTVAIFKQALAHAEGLANRGVTNIDFALLLAQLLTQHAGMSGAVIFDHGETIGEIAHAVTGMHERLKAAEGEIAHLRQTLDATLAELVLVRRDLLDKELDA